VHPSESDETEIDAEFSPGFRRESSESFSLSGALLVARLEIDVRPESEFYELDLVLLLAARGGETHRMENLRRLSVTKPIVESPELPSSGTVRIDPNHVEPVALPMPILNSFCLVDDGG
jgi:hypothetical protein